MTRDVLCLHPLRPAQQAELERRYRVHPPEAALDPAVAPRIEAIVTSGHVPLGRDLLDRLPRLALVACGSAGTESIDASALRERAIPLHTVSDALADDVADMALLLLMAAWRDLAGLERHVRSGAWARGEAPLGRALKGRALGVAGIGPVGQAIARRGEALGLRVAYHARHARPDLPWPFEPDLLRLAEASDVLAVALPGGDATRGAVSGAVIEALGPQGCLVNVGRGTAVDEPALVDALRSGRLGSAGLDVFANEPTPDPRLLDLPNVVLTPHAASASEDTRTAMSQMVLDALDARLAAGPPA